MNESREIKLSSAMSAHADFIRSEKRKHPDLIWPDYQHERYDKVFGPPGVKKLWNVFMRCFELVLPYLKRDLFNRVPGKSIKIDSTFKWAKHTKDDPESPV